MHEKHLASTPQLDFGFDGATVGTAPENKAKARKTKLAAPAVLSDPEALARQLERHPDYRVLRRLVPQRRFDAVPQGPLIQVLVLDTETTGLDQSRDKIIELALLRVAVDTVTGLPCGEVLVYDELQDPGMPISKEIAAITGITNAMVRGQQLDEARIAVMLDGVSLVIAHNAAFDRPFVEARVPQFSALPWACSFADINWKQEGQGSAKLENLALSQGIFYDAHRAEVDCHALLAVLQAQLPVARQTGLARMLAAARMPGYRLQATAAPFEAKDKLKSRGYRWNAEARVWQTMLADEALLQAECEWLKTAVYGNRAARVQLEKLDARVKYSGRTAEQSVREL
jgi:DNA polymerase III subunit epsilon